MSREEPLLWEPDPVEQAKEAGLDYVSRQLRTRREVEQHLQKKQFANDAIQGALAFLEEYGYVNDRAYCKSWIYDRMTFHPCGRMKMEQDLAKKVSDRSLIRESLEEFFPRETEEDLALEAAKQKLRGTSKRLKKDQLIRFLLGRGYSLSIARNIVFREEIASQLEQKEYLEEDFME